MNEVVESTLIRDTVTSTCLFMKDLLSRHWLGLLYRFTCINVIIWFMSFFFRLYFSHYILSWIPRPHHRHTRHQVTSQTHCAWPVQVTGWILCGVWIDHSICNNMTSLVHERWDGMAVCFAYAHDITTCPRGDQCCWVMRRIPRTSTECWLTR